MAVAQEQVVKRQPAVIDRLKSLMNANSVQQQFRNALAENSGPFIASVIDLVSSDKNLRECDPNLIIMECLKAATLKLPINKQLGFAYVVPYSKVPTFQIGYKGYIQLAMRTGQYRNLNAGIVCEGIKVNRNLLTGEITFTGEPVSTKPQGYFTYMELLNSFSKTLYMTRDEVLAHAKRYSKSYKVATSAWHTNEDEMCTKTTTRLLLSKYGILSTEMISAFTGDAADEDIDREIAREANGKVIDIQCATIDEAPEDAGDAEPDAAEQESEQPEPPRGPGF
jgi:recombination protein RecT